MARTYKRDSRGRFAGVGGGGGGGGKSRPAPRQIQRGVNRLTRDNAGRITSVGGSGTTARGGRIRTAAGNLRATTTAKIGRTKASGTVAKPRKLKADKNAAVKLATNQRLRARAAARDTEMKKQQAKPARFNASEIAERKARADQLRSLPKNARAAVALAGRAEREQRSRFLPTGKGRRGTQSNINNILEGQTRLFNKRLGAGERAAIARSMAASGQSLRARLKTTRLGKKLTQFAPTAATKRLRNARPFSSTVAKPKGLKPQPTRMAAAAAAPKRKSVGSISEAKAGRIISRIDANRPGLRKATGSARKTQNSIRTQRKATEFALAAGARARKQGKSLSVNESLQRAVKNATSKPARTRGAAKPASEKKNSVKTTRVRVRGNFRPQNVMANPAPDKTKYFKNQKGKNIAVFEAIAKKAGANTQVVTKRKQKLATAMAFKPMNLVRFNKASEFYANPRQALRAQRRMGQLSTTDPRGIVYHELGHLRQKKKSENIFTQREFSSPRNARVAGRVSQYAKTNANEFAAETYAGLKTGRKYDSQVMRAYRQEMGLRPLSVRRQLRRKGLK